MRVFISWSGEPSRSVAQALRDWLPMVVQHVEPWMSEADIESGKRWNEEVAAELEQADYGIICMTKANIDRPWLLFEAGALAKRFELARLVPLLIDLTVADVTMPLASFQGRPLSQDGMLRLVKDMNAGREPPLPSEQIDQLFAGMWPILEKRVAMALAAIPPKGAVQTSHKNQDVMAELVETVRRIERRMDTVPTDTVMNLSEAAQSVMFSDELADAIAQLAMYHSFGEKWNSDELKSLVLRFRGLISLAQEIGLPVHPRHYRIALDKYHRRYDPQYDNGFRDQAR
jgi:hypothetical protein